MAIRYDRWRILGDNPLCGSIVFRVQWDEFLSALGPNREQAAQSRSPGPHHRTERGFIHGLEPSS